MKISLANHLCDTHFSYVVSSNQKTRQSEPARYFLLPLKIIFSMAERFPPLETSLNEFIAEKKNKDTRAKAERDVKLLKTFLTMKGESRKPEELKRQQLKGHLCEFILRKPGTYYTGIWPQECPKYLKQLQPCFHSTRYIKIKKNKLVLDRIYGTRECLANALVSR